MKLLIDTGATKSFLNPEIAEKHFLNYIKKENFTISSIFQTTNRDQVAEIPAFEEFSTRENIKLYLLKFHNFFDGLIGYETLKKLKANIDLENSCLITSNSKLPLLHYEIKNKCLLFARIEPYTVESFKIPVSIDKLQN